MLPKPHRPVDESQTHAPATMHIGAIPWHSASLVHGPHAPVVALQMVEPAPVPQ